MGDSEIQTGTIHIPSGNAATNPTLGTLLLERKNISGSFKLLSHQL
jgi:hypothetical protein